MKNPPRAAPLITLMLITISKIIFYMVSFCHSLLVCSPSARLVYCALFNYRANSYLRHGPPLLHMTPTPRTARTARRVASLLFPRRTPRLVPHRTPTARRGKASARMAIRKPPNSSVAPTPYCPTLKLQLLLPPPIQPTLQKTHHCVNDRRVTLLVPNVCDIINQPNREVIVTPSVTIPTPHPKHIRSPATSTLTLLSLHRTIHPNHQDTQMHL